ncbi:MAG: (d)CMP kinase [Bacteroidales bacterium]
MKKDIIIAIDGHSACGKSTFAKAIAQHLGYTFIDTGAMYRSVTLYALEHQIIHADSFIDKEQLIEELPKIDIQLRYNKQTMDTEVLLNNKNVEGKIRHANVSQYVSLIAEIAQVRERLVALQKKMGQLKGIVMDGRDISTTVFPNAEIKIFMTASIEVRTQRRHKEMLQKGIDMPIKDVQHNLQERDRIDESRSNSPLTKTPDAILLDNSNLSLQQQMEWIINVINSRNL